MNHHLHLLKFFVTILLLNLSSQLFAQNSGTDYQLLLKSEKRMVVENFDEFLNQPHFQNEEIVDGKFYRIVQFFQIPTNSQKSDLERKGIEFLGYLPHKAYLASFPKNINKQELKNSGIRAILPLDASMKIDKTLIELDTNHESVSGNQVEILVSFYKNVSMNWLENKMRNQSGVVLKPMREAHKMIFQTTEDKLQELAELPFVLYLSIRPEKGEPEDRLGRSLHRSNMIDTEYAGGMKFNGDGVSVMVRDDGFVGPHIDFKGRATQTTTGDSPGNHAEGVAGILSGAGNLDPDMKGMASRSETHIIEYFDDFEENLISLDAHQNDGVLIVNSSYSNGCNAGYTEITEIVDRHIYENPSFLHVFSAGNSNNLDCGYGASNQWGNITGGHKQGKNVIATANLFENAVIVGSSSRGPAHDGRIKPDIAANGQEQFSIDNFDRYKSFGGTSGAAPGIAGISAQLHQAYRQFNGGETANAALIKSAMLNTANDLGNVGPDFIFGWGHVNSYRALKLLEDGRYETTQISQGESNTHTITVPSNAVEVRFMIYWNEQSANVMTNKALINDLDMVATDPTGAQKLPWILDATPDDALLDLPATNGVDRLNNVEQVLFDNPVPGDYTIDVSGFEVPMGPQDYFILYEIITEEITVTYPLGGEGMEPGVQERIRWEAYGDDGDFLLEYTNDNGMTWQEITSQEGDRRGFLWTPPSDISGQVRVRVSRNGFSDESDQNFSICSRPTNVQASEFCSDDFLKVSWDPVVEATGYDVFYLGERFMDSVGTTVDTFFNIPLPSPTGDHWFSVRAKGDNGLRGKRTIAVKYNGGLLNCNLMNDVAITKLIVPEGTSLVDCSAFQRSVTIEVKNESQTDQSDLSLSYQFENQAVVTEMYNGTLAAGESIEYTFTPVVDFPTAGIYNIKTWTTIPVDEVGFNDTINREIIVEIEDPETVPLWVREGFGGPVFPPENWFTSNPNEGIGWQRINNIRGSDGERTWAAIIRNRYNEMLGDRDELFSIPIDLTVVDTPVVVFDVAYAYKSIFCSDTLVVDLYTDCGETYVGEVLRIAGPELITDGIENENWVPNSFTGADWRQEAIFLHDYIDDEVVLKFVNINDNCGTLLLDNINIADFGPPEPSFTTVDEACLFDNIVFENTSEEVLTNYSWQFGSGATQGFSTDFTPDTIQYFNAGEKTVLLIASNSAGVDTFEHVINVIDLPVADFSVSQVGLGYQFNNESDFATGFFWDFGDNTTSTEENPFKEYSQPGNYNVTLNVDNICDIDFISEGVDVTVTNVFDISENINLEIIPNPNDGVFNLKIEDVESRDLEITILDIQGRNIGTWTTQSVIGETYFPIEKQNLAAGLFFVKITTDGGVKVLKMVVE